MKLKHALIAVFVFFSAEPSSGAVDPNFERHARVATCTLSPAETTVLDARWNKLAMRHFMVSMEAGFDPAEARRIRKEVEDGLTALRREFGPACVLDII